MLVQTRLLGGATPAEHAAHEDPARRLMAQQRHDEIAMLRIKNERLRRGWNQTKLAYLARMSTTDVSRIESGRTHPYPRQLARLAKALHVPVDDLMQEIDERAAGTPSDSHDHS